MKFRKIVAAAILAATLTIPVFAQKNSATLSCKLSAYETAPNVPVVATATGGAGVAGDYGYFLIADSAVKKTLTNSSVEVSFQAEGLYHIVVGTVGGEYALCGQLFVRLPPSQASAGINIVVAGSGSSFGKNAYITPKGSPVVLSWSSTGASSCQIGEWSGISGSVSYDPIDSVTFAVSCKGLDGSRLDTWYSLVVNDRGSIAVSEGFSGKLVVGVGEEVSLYSVPSQGYKIQWEVPGGFPSIGQTEVSSVFRTRFTQPGLKVIKATSDSGQSSLCQVLVLGTQPAPALPVIRRDGTGRVVLEVGEVGLAAGMLSYQPVRPMRGLNSIPGRIKIEEIKSGAQIILDVPQGDFFLTYESADAECSWRMKIPPRAE